MMVQRRPFILRSSTNRASGARDGVAVAAAAAPREESWTSSTRELSGDESSSLSSDRCRSRSSSEDTSSSASSSFWKRKFTSSSSSNGSSSGNTSDSSTSEQEATTEAAATAKAVAEVNDDSFWLLGLPTEIAVQVFSYLTVTDTRAVLQVNSTCRALLDGTNVEGKVVVWRQHAQRQWPWLRDNDKPAAVAEENDDVDNVQDGESCCRLEFTQSSPSQLMAVARKQPVTMHGFARWNAGPSLNLRTLTLSDEDLKENDDHRPIMHHHRRHNEGGDEESNQPRQQQQQRKDHHLKTYYQYVGRVGKGNRCLRGNVPLPRPFLIPSKRKSFWQKLLSASTNLNKNSDPESLSSSQLLKGLRPFCVPLKLHRHDPLTVTFAPSFVSYFEVSIQARPKRQVLPQPHMDHRLSVHPQQQDGEQAINNNNRASSFLELFSPLNNSDDDGESNDCVAIGVCLRSFRGDMRMPGWDPSSIGYHSDDGGLFFGSGRAMMRHYGPTYGVGDTVGCGVDYTTDELFFTLNGEYLGVADKLNGLNQTHQQHQHPDHQPQQTVDSKQKPALYPVVGLDTNHLIHCNFTGPFQFDLQHYMADYEQPFIEPAMTVPTAVALSNKSCSKHSIKSTLRSRHRRRRPKLNKL